jgi:hypothetical protein
MTEAEYIQTIRKAAEGYLEVLRDPDAFDRDHDEAMRRIEHWAAIKVKLSPNTMIKLCDLWLEGNGGDASQEGHSESAAGEKALSGIGVGQERSARPEPTSSH